MESIDPLLEPGKLVLHPSFSLLANCVTYSAIFFISPSYHSLKVHFKDSNGNLIKTVEVNEGDDILYIAHEYDIDLEGTSTAFPFRSVVSFTKLLLTSRLFSSCVHISLTLISYHRPSPTLSYLGTTEQGTTEQGTIEQGPPKAQ